MPSPLLDRAPADTGWRSIFDSTTRIVIDPHTEPGAVLPWRDDVEALLDLAPFAHRASDTPAAVGQGLCGFAPRLTPVVTCLATRFAALMGCETVRVRLEGVTGNACRKVHADYTDLRLICTLAGPGTDYTLGDDPDAPLLRVPTGAVALFKGLAFGTGHKPCLHRSPPIEGSGERRLVLVIDTPARHPDD